jgi:hypothetical protein
MFVSACSCTLSRKTSCPFCKKKISWNYMSSMQSYLYFYANAWLFFFEIFFLLNFWPGACSNPGSATDSCGYCVAFNKYRTCKLCLAEISVPNVETFKDNMVGFVLLPFSWELANMYVIHTRIGRYAFLICPLPGRNGKFKKIMVYAVSLLGHVP